ncbi:MAG: ComEC family competence protein [Anaerolineae bacterium]|nr:ComEC family competence protein [Anaerolineae bacterium]
MTLLYIAFGWIVGLYIAAAAPVTQSLWVSVVVIGAAVAIFFRRETTLRLAGLVVLVGGLALWRSTAAQMAITPSHVAHYNDAGYADVIGMVSAAPDVSDNAIRLRVSVERYRRYEVQELVTGDVLVYADRQGDFRYGDWVRISGSLDTPTVFDTFSWRDYLARQGIYTVIFRAKVEVLDRDRGNPITAALLSIRDQAREVIYKVLPSPSSDFMAGILLGDDSGFAPEVSESFRKTGTSHLLAISGANMVVVIGLLHAIFSRLIKKPRAVVVVSITGIVLYTIFVGASASVVRAAIMSSLGLIAQRVGRRSDALTSLAATFMLLTIINPNSAFDLGLIFSTAATLGLLLYLPPLQKWTEALLHRLFHAETAQKIASVLADVILIGLAAQIIVLPLMIFFFQEFSLVSFPVNILVAPVQAPIMILGIVMMFLGMIWLPLGQIVAWLVQLPLIYMLSVIRSAAATSGTLIFNLSPSILVGYYAFALGIPYVASMPPGQRQVWWKTLRSTFSFSLLTIVGLGVATLLWIVVLSRPDGKLHVNFLDVGEGIAVRKGFVRTWA